MKSGAVVDHNLNLNIHEVLFVIVVEVLIGTLVIVNELWGVLGVMEGVEVKSFKCYNFRCILF